MSSIDSRASYYNYNGYNGSTTTTSATRYMYQPQKPSSRSLHKARSLPAVSRKNSDLQRGGRDVGQRRRCMTGQEMNRDRAGLPRLAAAADSGRQGPRQDSMFTPAGVDLRSFPEETRLYGWKLDDELSLLSAKLKELEKRYDQLMSGQNNEDDGRTRELVELRSKVEQLELQETRLRLQLSEQQQQQPPQQPPPGSHPTRQQQQQQQSQSSSRATEPNVNKLERRPFLLIPAVPSAPSAAEYPTTNGLQYDDDEHINSTHTAHTARSEQSEQEADTALRCISQFNELMKAKKYKQAAELAANSHNGILRTPDTMKRFKEAVSSSKPTTQSLSPALMYCHALLAVNVRLDDSLTADVVAAALDENKLDLVRNWTTAQHERLTLSESLGDLIYAHSELNPRQTRQCLELAERIYVAVQSVVGALVCKVRLCRLDDALVYAEQQQCSESQLTQVLYSCPGLQLSRALFKTTDNSASRTVVNVVSNNHVDRPQLPLGVILLTLLGADAPDVAMQFLVEIYETCVQRGVTFAPGECPALRRHVTRDATTRHEEWLDVVHKCQEFGHHALAIDLLTTVTSVFAERCSPRQQCGPPPGPVLVHPSAAAAAGGSGGVGGPDRSPNVAKRPPLPPPANHNKTVVNGDVSVRHQPRLQQTSPTTSTSSIQLQRTAVNRPRPQPTDAADTSNSLKQSAAATPSNVAGVHSVAADRSKHDDVQCRQQKKMPAAAWEQTAPSYATDSHAKKRRRRRRFEDVGSGDSDSEADGELSDDGV